MKRTISIVLVAALLLGLIAMIAPMIVSATEDPSSNTSGATTPEETRMVTGDECVRMIKEYEGFCKKPVWDYAQWTVGYGTRCPDDMVDYYLANGITEAEAETLLRNYLNLFENEIHTRIIEKGGVQLTQNQFDALISFSYNVGTGWTYTTTGTIYKAIVEGWTGNDLVRAFALWCSAGGDILIPLLNRRLAEANMYLNGVYSRYPGDEFCYVLFNANGGTSDSRTQGYCTKWEAKIIPSAQYQGRTFEGWYTERTGGQKVEYLTAEYHGKTLYAHWSGEGTDVEQPTQDPVKVTVTGEDVNVRKGPGTNYTTVDRVTKGDVLEITEVSNGWGKCELGWLSLMYTTYDKVINGEDTTPPEEDPTEPEETEPEETEPEETEPEETEPEVTDPPAQQKVMGTVNVTESLNVRQGPSTGYAVVGYLCPKQRVEILEQKVVGASTWGRIANGWISMSYVILDSQGSTGSDNNTGSSNQTTSNTGVIVDCSILRIRKGPGTDYDIAGYMNPGDKVTILETKQVASVTWGRTSQGWISMDYVKLDKTGSTGGDSGTQTGSVFGTVSVNGFLCVRQAPGASSAVVGYLADGRRVEILEQKTVGATTWGRMSFGWISMDYVKLENSSSGNTGNTGNTGSTGSTDNTGSADGVYGVIQVGDSLNIRGGAGTEYPVVGSYGAKVRVKILEQKTVGDITWGRTDKGWVSMAYVKLEVTGPQSGDTVTVTADCLNVRSEPGSNSGIVSFLYYGTKVTITEIKFVEGVQWGRIANGWISMAYVK